MLNFTVIVLVKCATVQTVEFSVKPLAFNNCSLFWRNDASAHGNAIIMNFARSGLIHGGHWSSHKCSIRWACFDFPDLTIHCSTEILHTVKCICFALHVL